MAAPAAHPKSEMQVDIDNWVARASAVSKDPSGITAPAGTASWSSGFFECFNPVDTCAITYCCPCITFGKTHHRLHKDANLAGYSVVNASCLGWMGFACFGFHCIPNLLQRHDIRAKSQPNLAGNFATDFLKAWCCNCCDLVQQDKEAAHLMAHSAVEVNFQPTKAEGMTYAPPAAQAPLP